MSTPPLPFLEPETTCLPGALEVTGVGNASSGP